MSDSTYLPNFQIILFEMDETIMFGRCVKVIFGLPHSCLQQLFWWQQTSAELIASIFSRLMVGAEPVAELARELVAYYLNLPTQFWSISKARSRLCRRRR